MDEKIKAAYALNLWTVSVAQIVDYNDVYILEQEYDNIMNNLNLEHMPKDEALLDIIQKILEEITNLRMDEGDKKMLERRYQHQLKNAVWSAVPNIGAIFATRDPVALGITLATQVGIGYMNYRRNKANYAIENEDAQWEIQKHRMQHLHGLQNELLGTAWHVAEKYQFPDEYRLSANQIKQYNEALMEPNLVKRYNKLDSMRRHFTAYPAFWYQIGSTANSIFRSNQFQADPDSQGYYKSCAIECFAKYKELNKFNLLRHDILTASWALEYLELLDLNYDNNIVGAKELIEIAEQHSGNDLDVLELCAFAYLRIRDEKNAARIFHILVNNGYNEEINTQILSGLYIKQMRSTDSNDAMLARVHYKQLFHITDTQYILDIPPADIELSDWKPSWNREDTFEEFVGEHVDVPRSADDINVSEDTQFADAIDEQHNDLISQRKAEILESRLAILQRDHSSFYRPVKDFSKAELWTALLQMANPEENEADVLGVYDVDPFHALNGKFSGILFMKDGFYFKQNDSATTKYMKYSDIRYVEEKFASLIVESKADIIKMKSCSFAQSHITDIFRDMRSLYKEQS